jgi:hypothetical protein
MSTPDTPDPQAAADAATVDHLMAALEAQFSDRLDDAAREHIRQQFVGMVAQGRALAAYPLSSSVEPTFVFTARREG